VGGVVAGGPSDHAGLRTGDRIVAIGDRTIGKSTDVVSAISALRPGEKVAVRVRRGGSERTVTVKLGTRPAVASPG
jgi:S1-C subfamily serine protease